MKNFLIALKLVKIIRSSDSWNSYSISDIYDYCRKLWYSFDWYIKNGYDLDILNKLKYADNDRIRSQKEKSELRKELHTCEQQLAQALLKHEEEIIRLKDLVQAKQVQIDKLLEGK